MPQKRLTTNGNVFRRTDGRWQSVIWYFDEQGVKRRKVFSSKTKTEAQQKITTYITQFKFSNSPRWSGQHTTGWNAQLNTKYSRSSGRKSWGTLQRQT